MHYVSVYQTQYNQLSLLKFFGKTKVTVGQQCTTEFSYIKMKTSLLILSSNIYTNFSLP